MIISKRRDSMSNIKAQRPKERSKKHRGVIKSDDELEHRKTPKLNEQFPKYILEQLDLPKILALCKELEAKNKFGLKTNKKEDSSCSDAFEDSLEI